MGVAEAFKEMSDEGKITHKQMEVLENNAKELKDALAHDAELQERVHDLL